MAQPTNHWKLGLFVVAGFVLALATIAFLAARSLRRESVTYVTYYDESVQGLEVGSPVKFRGVTIGNVSGIDVGPDRKHIAVHSSLGTRQIHDLGLVEGEGKNTKDTMPPNLRAQIASQGITGVKFLQIDFFEEKDNPRPQLPFEVREPYIPAAVSTMKSLEDAIVRAVNRLPEIADSMNRISGRIDFIVADIAENKIPEKVAGVLLQAHATLVTANDSVKKLDTGKLSGLTAEGLANLNAAIARTNVLLARLDSQTGLLSRAENSTTQFGEAATSVRGVGQEVEATLRELQDTAASIRRVAESLEQDPDMLLKGRSKK